MTPHETVRQLLALSAAGVLEPDEERQVRQHVRECPECAATLTELSELGGAIAALPVPQPAEVLVARTQARVAAEAASQIEQRRNVLLAAGLGLFAWATTLIAWAVWRLLTGGTVAVLRIDETGIVAWLVWNALTLSMALPAAAMLAAARRRKEGKYL